MWVEIHNEWDIEHSETCNQQTENMDLNRDELDAKLEYLRRKEKINELNQSKTNKMRTTTEEIREESERGIENPLLQDMVDTFSACFETATRKNHDYGGSNNDPYANFRNSTIAGVTVERGILVRLMDKMSRISTLLDKEAMVIDEAVDDTIDDAINYLAILKSYRKRNK